MSDLLFMEESGLKISDLEENPAILEQVLTPLEFFCLRQNIVYGSPLTITQFYFDLLKNKYLITVAQNLVDIVKANGFLEYKAEDSTPSFNIYNYNLNNTSTIRKIEAFLSKHDVAVQRQRTIENACETLVAINVFCKREGEHKSKKLYFLHPKLARLVPIIKEHLKKTESQQLDDSVKLVNGRYQITSKNYSFPKIVLFSN